MSISTNWNLHSFFFFFRAVTFEHLQWVKLKQGPWTLPAPVEGLLSSHLDLGKGIDVATSHDLHLVRSWTVATQIGYKDMDHPPFGLMIVPKIEKHGTENQLVQVWWPEGQSENFWPQRIQQLQRDQHWNGQTDARWWTLRGACGTRLVIGKKTTIQTSTIWKVWKNTHKHIKSHRFNDLFDNTQNRMEHPPQYLAQ